MVWPLDKSFVVHLLAQQESNGLDFKREWYDLKTKRGKAEFAKDILAMANATQTDKPGFLIIGKSDLKDGGKLIGVDNSPTEEQIIEILSVYTSPTPEVKLQSVQLDGKKISVVGIFHTSEFPYYSNRDFTGVLSEFGVYFRRGSVNRLLRPSEFENLLRMNGKLAEKIISEKSIQAGFIELAEWNTSRVPTLKIINITAEEIRDVTVVFDVTGRFKPHPFCRVKTLTNALLKAGESREVELGLDRFHFRDFYDSDEQFNPRGKVEHGWLDITAHIQWRSRDGFLQFEQVSCILTN